MRDFAAHSSRGPFITARWERTKGAGELFGDFRGANRRALGIAIDLIRSSPATVNQSPRPNQFLFPIEAWCLFSVPVSVRSQRADCLINALISHVSFRRLIDLFGFTQPAILIDFCPQEGSSSRFGFADSQRW